jgi:hypothetical protein
MDTIKVAGYESTCNLDGAHVIWSEPANTYNPLAIVAIVPEPDARANDDADWDEDAWREAVRAAVLDAWGEPDSQNPVEIIIQWDPGRDKGEDETVYPSID